MKNSVTFSIAVLLLAFAALACSFSTANMSSLKTSSDREGNSESTKFKSGETFYASATISNNGGKVKVNFSMIPESVSEEVEGVTKGESIKQLEVTQEVEGDGVAIYKFTPGAAFPTGTYKINADMINEQGEKKDNKTITVTVE